MNDSECTCSPGPSVWQPYFATPFPHSPSCGDDHLTETNQRGRPRLTLIHSGNPRP